MKLLVILAALGASIVRVEPLPTDCVMVKAQSAESEAPNVRRRVIHHPYWEPVTIDVAVGWTQAILDHPKMGEAGAHQFAQDAIDHTNDVLRASGIFHITVRLVWQGRLDFADIPNATPDQAFAWMRSDASVANVRAVSGADEVWLITHWTEPSAAPVPILESDFNEDNGIAVINWQGGVHSATHEFGHTLGLFHDYSNIEEPPKVDPYPYRYAFYSKTANFKDIMTPRYKCPECDVYEAFSNAAPYMTYRGIVTGGAQSNAALLIPFAAAKVAGYR